LFDLIAITRAGIVSCASHHGAFRECKHKGECSASQRASEPVDEDQKAVKKKIPRSAAEEEEKTTKLPFFYDRQVIRYFYYSFRSYRRNEETRAACSNDSKSEISVSNPDAVRDAVAIAIHAREVSSVTE